MLVTYFSSLRFVVLQGVFQRKVKVYLLPLTVGWKNNLIAIFVYGHVLCKENYRSTVRTRYVIVESTFSF